MPSQPIKQIAMFVLALFSLAGYSNLTLATPITAQIDIASGWSLIHPMPNTGSSEWLWFDEGQSIGLDLDGGVLTLDGGPQAFSLSGSDGMASTLNVTGLTLDLNDSDGFLGGTLDYILDGMVGSFTFANSNYGNSVFNSSVLSNGNLAVYAWGGDSANGIGIDLGMTATVSEPAAVALMLVGLAGMGSVRWKKSSKTINS